MVALETCFLKELWHLVLRTEDVLSDGTFFQQSVHFLDVLTDCRIPHFFTAQEKHHSGFPDPLGQKIYMCYLTVLSSLTKAHHQRF